MSPRRVWEGVQPEGQFGAAYAGAFACVGCSPSLPVSTVAALLPRPLLHSARLDSSLRLPPRITDAGLQSKIEENSCCIPAHHCTTVLYCISTSLPVPLPFPPSIPSRLRAPIPIQLGLGLPLATLVYIPILLLPLSISTLAAPLFLSYDAIRYRLLKATYHERTKVLYSS
jgi:hypothetical protein